MANASSPSPARNIVIAVIVLLLIVVAALAISSYRSSDREAEAGPAVEPAGAAATGAATAAREGSVEVEMTCSNLGELPGFKRRHRVDRIGGDLDMSAGKAGVEGFEHWFGPYPTSADEVDVAGEYIEGPGGLKKSRFQFWMKDGKLAGFGMRGPRNCQIVEVAPKA